MLWTIIVILIVLWLLGFIGHFGGGLIHLLLVIAVVILHSTASGQTRSLNERLPKLLQGRVSRTRAPFTGVPLERELLKSKESILDLRLASIPSPSYKAMPAKHRPAARLV